MSNTLGSQNAPLPNSTPFNSYNTNDEIDLRELFYTLWQSKLLIVGVTLLFSACASVFAYIQPNTYQASATYVVNSDFLGMQDVRTPQLLNGVIFKQQLAQNAEAPMDSVSNVSVSLSKNVLSISSMGHDAQKVFEQVLLVSNNLNETLKSRELAKLESYSVDASESKTLFYSEELTSLLGAREIQKLLLGSPATQVVIPLSTAVKPTSHIKPKRALIIVLGTMLGGMLGVAIVLIRFAFRREEETEK